MHAKVLYGYIYIYSYTRALVRTYIYIIRVCMHFVWQERDIRTYFVYPKTRRQGLDRRILGRRVLKNNYFPSHGRRPLEIPLITAVITLVTAVMW